MKNTNITAANPTCPKKKFVGVFYAMNIFNTIYYFKPTNFKGVQVSDHVIDWIRGLARAFFSGFQNAASNEQRLHNIFCWYKMADGAIKEHCNNRYIVFSKKLRERYFDWVFDMIPTTYFV